RQAIALIRNAKRFMLDLPRESSLVLPLAVAPRQGNIPYRGWAKIQPGGPRFRTISARKETGPGVGAWACLMEAKSRSVDSAFLICTTATFERCLPRSQPAESEDRKRGSFHSCGRSRWSLRNTVH